MKTHLDTVLHTRKARIIAGFTLVELLAVISIIGILATVTIVSYQGVREKARNDYAISTMQKVMVEASLYRANNGGYTGLCSDTSVTAIFTDITNAVQDNPGTSARCQASATGYEIHVRLLGTTEHYCIDGRKTFKRVPGTNAVTDNCNA